MELSFERNIKFSILNQEDISMIHQTSLTLMEEVGMKIQGRRVLNLLQDYGAKLSADGLTKIPSSLVENALKTVPKAFILYTREGEPVFKIDCKSIYFGTHADQLQLLDPVTGQARKFFKEDIQLMAKLADYLPNIEFVLSVGLTSDVNAKIQSQVTFIETIRHFSKPINFSSNDVQGLKDIIEIASLVSGGRLKLQEKPFIFYYCEPIPPLTHPEESTEKLWICAENRLPVVYMPYCMMGGTAPMAFAATLAQCNAEVLTGLVITQLVNAGTPFIYGAMPSIFDMRTTIGSYGAPEFHLLVAAASEMAFYYGLPFYGTAGTTDAKVIDEQAVAEVTMSCFSTLLSKANIIHDVGIMDHCNSVSPELVVLADEIIEMLKSFSRGVEVNQDTLALEVIREIQPGGHYLTSEHTANNFKTVWYPQFFSRKMQNKETSEIREKIKATITNIMNTHQIPGLDPQLEKEIEQYYHKLTSTRLNHRVIS